MKKGILIILSGPSGVGKGTIRKELMSRHSELNLFYSISMTTREPRVGEIDGKDYFFVSEETFNANLDKNNFIEHAEFVGHKYGTPKDYVEKLRSEGKNVLLEIDIRGAKQVMTQMFNENLLTIFITAPSIDDIKNRILKRHTESEAQLNERLEKARTELHLSYLYDYVVTNDEVSRTVDEIAGLIKNKIDSVTNE